MKHQHHQNVARRTGSSSYAPSSGSVTRPERQMREARVFRSAALARRGRQQAGGNELAPPPRRWMVMGWAASVILVVLASAVLSRDMGWPDLLRLLQVGR